MAAKKQKVYIWTENIQISRIEEGSSNYQNAKREGLTPRENIANILENCPGDGVEGILEILLQSVKYGLDMGESDRAILSRMNADLFSLTSDHKRNFG